MKKVLIIINLFLATNLIAQQRVVAECTVTYTISTDSTADIALQEMLKRSTKTVYIKGNDSRTDLVNPSFKQSVIYDKGTGEVIILREFGNNKVMNKLTKLEWVEKNKSLEGVALSPTQETKTILGYQCKKAILNTKDGNSTVLYYATAIVPSVKEFEFQFKEVPGMVLEYELFDAKKKIKYTYTATKINLNPISANLFVEPTSGYRIEVNKE